MINVESFYNTLISYEIDFFTGVPDSLLKSFCAYISDEEEKNNIIAANEVNAVVLDTGYNIFVRKGSFAEYASSSLADN